MGIFIGLIERIKKMIGYGSHRPAKKTSHKTKHKNMPKKKKKYPKRK